MSSRNQEHRGSPPQGTVRAVHAGPVRSLRSPREPGGAVTRWRSAILKDAITAPVHVRTLGLDGDAQKETRHHGGPEKAVLLYAAGHYDIWGTHLRAHATLHAAALRAMSTECNASRFGFGAFGENLTVEGLDEASVYLGDVWAIGDCELRVTEPRGPCATLARRWMRPALIDEVKATAAAGWYNAVVREGAVREGDTVRLCSRVQEEWSVARVFHLLEGRVVSRADVSALRDAPFTHEALRSRLARRAMTAWRVRA